MPPPPSIACTTLLLGAHQRYITIPVPDRFRLSGASHVTRIVMWVFTCEIVARQPGLSTVENGSLSLSPVTPGAWSRTKKGLGDALSRDIVILLIKQWAPRRSWPSTRG
ncbi:hypothetical protein CISG_10117 [Coccidioides immitis RMSCC 3703]|uniref:Uncharacterized protein n=1 Tax=Coccidioides immitis RMSCC 3703 TaxID=454286 RepID=A0A0J8TIL6_COCIT|nr:hypothetical protein CISG_10117 [Coccidioides immitis RMSCC 3703]